MKTRYYRQISTSVVLIIYYLAIKGIIFFIVYVKHTHKKLIFSFIVKIRG